jgi:hypothetical protein
MTMECPLNVANVRSLACLAEPGINGHIPAPVLTTHLTTRARKELCELERKHALTQLDCKQSFR